MYRKTFYEEYPMGIMTPTTRPDTGCPRCLKGKSCYDHGYKVIMDMLLTLWADIRELMSHIPLEEGGVWLRSPLQMAFKRFTATSSKAGAEEATSKAKTGEAYGWCFSRYSEAHS